MRLRTLRPNLPLKGKRVLMRIDANVPIKGGKVVDGPHGKIARAAVDVDWLVQHGARVILMTHLGRPDGRRHSAYSVRPIARRLSDLLGKDVQFVPDLVGPKVVRKVASLENGDVLLLENIRFDSREETDSPAFARALAQLADLYVNDAFAASHRAHASVDAITDELPSYAGPQFASEVMTLTKAMRQAKTPFVLAMGGLKVADKAPVMKRLLPHVDSVLVGGALANAFLKAQGKPIGRSIYDPAGVKTAKAILKRAKKKVLLPVDVVVASSLRCGAHTRHVSVDQVGAKDYIVDIGRRTMRNYLREIHAAKTIVWNGPFGYVECPEFSHGTSLLARGIASRTGKAMTVVGGGDTSPLLESVGLADRFTLLSTGGGAMLEFLSGKDLPGIAPLEA
jgi:phosphoglycerate kinase